MFFFTRKIPRPPVLSNSALLEVSASSLDNGSKGFPLSKNWITTCSGSFVTLQLMVAFPTSGL
jgi:hypothetical protein